MCNCNVSFDCVSEDITSDRFCLVMIYNAPWLSDEIRCEVASSSQEGTPWFLPCSFRPFIFNVQRMVELGILLPCQRYEDPCWERSHSPFRIFDFFIWRHSELENTMMGTYHSVLKGNPFEMAKLMKRALRWKTKLVGFCRSGGSGCYSRWSHDRENQQNVICLSALLVEFLWCIRISTPSSENDIVIQYCCGIYIPWALPSNDGGV